MLDQGGRIGLDRGRAFRMVRLARKARRQEDQAAVGDGWPARGRWGHREEVILSVLQDALSGRLAYGVIMMNGIHSKERKALMWGDFGLLVIEAARVDVTRS